MRRILHDPRGDGRALPTYPRGVDPNTDAVDEYMATLEGDAHSIAQQVRRMIHRAKPGIEETVRYKMPCFSIDGEYLVYLGAWKKHLRSLPDPGT